MNILTICIRMFPFSSWKIHKITWKIKEHTQKFHSIFNEIKRSNIHQIHNTQKAPVWSESWQKPYRKGHEHCQRAWASQALPWRWHRSMLSKTVVLQKDLLWARLTSELRCTRAEILGVGGGGGNPNSKSQNSLATTSLLRVRSPPWNAEILCLDCKRLWENGKRLLWIGFGLWTQRRLAGPKEHREPPYQNSNSVAIEEVTNSGNYIFFLNWKIILKIVLLRKLNFPSIINFLKRER